MKTRIITIAAVAGLLAALATGDVLAAGRGNGGGNGKRNGSCMTNPAATGGTTAVRPTGSQRRDGTFLTTGTTANGSTTRQGKGNGVMNGSRLTPPAATGTTPPASITTP